MVIDLNVVGAALIGFFGSVHCVGMCGGIVGALSGFSNTESRKKLWKLLLAYNLGRIISYSLAGVLAGFLGSSALNFFSPNHVKSVGIIMSGLFLFALGLYISNWWRGLEILEQFGAKLWSRIEPWGRRQIPIAGMRQAISLGLIWGWLPCSLVYSTLIWSMTSADPLRSGAMMGAFGIGTLPMLVTMGFASKFLLTLTRHKKVRQLVGLIIMTFGLLTLFGISRPHQLNDHPVEDIFCGPDFFRQ
jgi:sulfite exporter TauE/SafE|tara:strand:+ start:2350 stop:3087 length:738 start_codon:yes stop_codon:yes gene_type:complete